MSSSTNQSWRRWISAATTGATRVSTVISSVAIIGLMLHVLLDVALRNFAGTTMRGTVDYVSYWWMVPAVLFGIVVAAGNREHIDIGMLIDRLGERSQRWIGGAATILTAVLALGFAWYGYDEFMKQWERGEYSGATGIEIWPMRSVVAISMALFAALLVWSLFDRRSTETDPLSPIPIPEAEQLPLPEPGQHTAESGQPVEGRTER